MTRRPTTPEQLRARRSWRRALVVTILSVTYSGTAIAFDPIETRLIVQLELAIIGVTLVLLAAGALRRTTPLAPRSPLDHVVRPAPPAARPLPIDLVRVSRRLAASEASAADARRHLGPLVAAIAADRMRRGSHTSVEADSVYAALPRPVSPELELVLDPALAALDTRSMPGLDAGGTEALVSALEEL